MPDTNEKATITLTEEQFKAINESLDKVKSLEAEIISLKETKKDTTENHKTTKPDTSIRDSIIADEKKLEEQRKLEEAIEKETGLRTYLLETATSLGGRSEKIAKEFKANYYDKGFATKKTNSEFLKEFITEIATDKELNKYIPSYKQQEIKQFLELPENTVEEKDVKLSKSRGLIDIINSTLEIKGRVEEEVARAKANESFNGESQTNTDTQPLYTEAKEKQRKHMANGGGIVW